MNDLVSVIIVNFNGGMMLADCVQAVLTSTIPIEIFLVDNASSDESIDIVRQGMIHEKRLHIIENKENIGFASAANQMLSQTQGNYLLFLNPDCMIRPDTLARFCAVMDERPQAGMAGALVRNLDGSEQAGCRRSIPSPWRSLVRVFHLDKIFPNNPRFKSFVLTQEPLPNTVIEIEGISGACMFVRRAALDSVGAMDESYFLHCEDLDWFMRFHAKGWAILFIPDIEVIHAKGICSRRQPIRVLWYKHRGMVRFYRKFFQHRYPQYLMWTVTLAVWIRFAILAIITLITRKN
jgi:GT2 family glycosyltransferase